MGRPRVNRVGETHRKLTVLASHGVDTRNETIWLCSCVCGNDCLILNRDIKKVMSCGCAKVHPPLVIKHGHWRSKRTTEYMAWASMIARCEYVPGKFYSEYGGRGITVCVRWRNSFQSFIDDLGLKPDPLLSLDRVDNNGNYEPGNCRWANKSTQQTNQRKRKRNV